MAFMKKLTPLLALGLAASVAAQDDVVIWHNRYHAILAMAAYGDWETLCPQQTFTPAALQANFPGSVSNPFEVLDRFGPTAHGAYGYTALIPEMNKVTLIFRGDYHLEKNLPLEPADLSEPLGLGDECPGCQANAFALTGYMEAWEETNGFALANAAYDRMKAENPDFYFSVTGHGLGGAHAIISTIHMRDRVFFTHNFGTPRILNQAAADFHNHLVGGDQADRGAANNDIFVTMVPQEAGYTFTNTAVLYHDWDDEFKMQSEFCYEAPEDARCLPQGELNEEDHYFYFSNVGQCGGSDRQNLDVARAFIASQQALGTGINSTVASSTVSSVVSSSSVISSVVSSSLPTSSIITTTADAGQNRTTAALSTTRASSSAVADQDSVATTRAAGVQAANGNAGNTAAAESGASISHAVTPAAVIMSMLVGSSIGALWF